MNSNNEKPDNCKSDSYSTYSLILSSLSIVLSTLIWASMFDIVHVVNEVGFLTAIMITPIIILIGFILRYKSKDEKLKDSCLKLLIMSTLSYLLAICLLIMFIAAFANE